MYAIRFGESSLSDPFKLKPATVKFWRLRFTNRFYVLCFIFFLFSQSLNYGKIGKNQRTVENKVCQRFENWQIIIVDPLDINPISKYVYARNPASFYSHVCLRPVQTASIFIYCLFFFPSYLVNIFRRINQSFIWNCIVHVCGDAIDTPNQK